MIGQQLYIDGILMDLFEETKVTLDIKSNLLSDITQMSSNYTYTVSLPKTMHNLTVLGMADKPMSDTVSPYEFHACRYIRDGLEIIPEGRLSLLSIGDDIQASIYWGLFPALQKLTESDKTLRDLKVSARLPFLRKNKIDTYDDAVSRGYFYASYDYRMVRDFGNNWRGTSSFVGRSNQTTYTISVGKVSTGTAVGATVTGKVESDGGYKYAMIPFLVGSTARISNIIGVGEYRSFAVLDSSRKVLVLADDARSGGGSGTVDVPTGEVDTMIDWNVMWANDNTDALTVKTLSVEVNAVSSDSIIEYGIIKDFATNATEKWGERSVPIGTSGTVGIDVNKSKKAGERIYVKTATKGLLTLRTVKGAVCYELFNSLSYSRRNNRQISYGFTYGDSGIQAEGYTIVAPQGAAYLIINADQRYSSGTELVITGNVISDTPTTNYWFNPTEQPSVSVKWLLGLIQEQLGVGFTWEGDSKGRIDTLAIPLVTRNGDIDMLSGKIDADFINTTKLGKLSFKLNESMDSFEQVAGGTYTQLKVKMECTLLFDVQMYWSWDASYTKPNEEMWWQTGDGSIVTDYLYRYPYNYIEMKVQSRDDEGKYTDENVKTYVIGDYDEDSLSDIMNGYASRQTDDGRFVHLLTGEGNIELITGDIITFELKNTRGTTLSGLSAYRGFIKASLSNTQEVPYGGSYPIGINLPDIKILDFIKFLSVITGTFPRQTSEGDTITMSEIEGVFDVFNHDIDWTRKLIPSSWRNTPRNIEYSISDYCKHNWYKWKEDDTVSGYYDADMGINNDTLEYTRDVWTLPFAASDGNRVPIYGWEKHELGVDKKYNVWSASEYKACKDRIMGLVKDDSGKATLTFNIDLQEIFDTKYSDIRNAISRAHVITEWFNLTDIDILNLNEIKSVYLSQYGAYFAVLELKVTDSGYSEVTMIQLDF